MVPTRGSGPDFRRGIYAILYWLIKYLTPDILGVANRILGLLLAALAMQTIINALGELGVVKIAK